MKLVRKVNLLTPACATLFSVSGGMEQQEPAAESPAPVSPLSPSREFENEASEPLLEHRHPPPGLRRYASNSTSQVAIVGSNVCPVESLDYENIENGVFRQAWPGSGRRVVFLKWALCLLIGILVAAAGFFTNMAVENVAGVKLWATARLMLAEKHGWAFAAFAGSNFVLLMFATVVTAYVAPAAGGSGIPEVKAYLNGVDAPNIFSVRTLIVKIVGGVAAVSSSLHVGKAGPMVHTGACIAALFGQNGSCKNSFTQKWLCYFQNDRERRDLVTYGAAAGVAAAFRAPVGGVLFALESLSSWWRSALLWRTFFTTAVVAVILRSLISICKSGKCGLFGEGGLIMYDVTSHDITYHLGDLPPVIVLGVLGGVLGSLYNFLMERIIKLYIRINEKGGSYKLLLAGIISIFTSCCLFGLPWLVPCSPCPVRNKDSCPSSCMSRKFNRFQCPSGQYNDLASLFFNTNDDTMRNLFSSGTNDVYDPFSLLLFLVATYLLSVLSYGVVAPSGLFVPVILTGAIYGRCLGMLMGSHSSLDHGLFAILGSASLLGGTMRMTVSVCVIMLELTNNLLLLPLVMLVLLVSKTVADSFNANIYDMILKLKGLPYLQATAEPYMRQISVGDVVSGPLRILNGVEKVGNIVHALKTTGHHGFPVIDEPPFANAPVLFGLVLRSHLLVVLKQKDFSPTCTLVGGDASKNHVAADFAKPVSEGLDSIDDIELTQEEMEMFIDLHPFTNSSPYSVVETMSVAKALILFRELGLRHLLVVPKSSSRAPMVGILTRHDFMPEHILGLHPSLTKSRWKRLRFESNTVVKLIKTFLRRREQSSSDATNLGSEG